MQLHQSVKLLICSLRVFKNTLEVSWLACLYWHCHLEWNLGFRLSELWQQLQWAAPALFMLDPEYPGSEEWGLLGLLHHNHGFPFSFSFWSSWVIVYFFLVGFIIDAVIMHQEPSCILFFTLHPISKKLLNSPLSDWKNIYAPYIYEIDTCRLIYYTFRGSIPLKCLLSKTSAFLINSVIFRVGNIGLWSPGLG